MLEHNQVGMGLDQKICPVCEGQEGHLRVMDIEDVPVLCNVLHPDRESALRAPRGAIHLVFCELCGHVYNTAFDPKMMQYSPNYENSLHFSPKFDGYAQALAARLVKEYDLQGKTIVEIGCGKGDFLSLLCRLGENEGIGFDPSYREERLPESERKRFRVIRDYYSGKYSDIQAHMVVCRHVLEHVRAPRKFLESLGSAVGNSGEAAIFFEVPNVTYTLKDLGIWDLIYEHCGYFSSISLNHLFKTCGYFPIHLEPAFGGQFICLEALTGNSKDVPVCLRIDRLEDLSSYATHFAETYRSKVKEWGGRLAEMNKQGKKAVIWGAGSKGVTFANIMKKQCEVEYVVDVNPHKQELYVPGAGQQVVGVEALKRIRPEVVIIMNPLYENEIRKMIKSQNLSCEIMAA